jgi:DNA-binding beta-propeller fold protein YncE
MKLRCNHRAPSSLSAIGRLMLVLLVLSSTAALATTTELAVGLSAGVGVALDRPNNRLYFVEYGAGTLKRMRLVPGCETAAPPNCPIDHPPIATSLVHPENVAIDVERGIAYVTTRDDPGTTGKLWRIDLTTGAKSLVTFNLDAPQQIVLDLGLNQAYTVGYDSGKLWRIDLTTGVKVAVARNLGHPVGLAINSDDSRAYVSEQDTGQVTEINLSTGVRLRAVATQLTAPFFLAWTDPSDAALYVVERDPANQVSRIDIPSLTKTVVAGSLAWRPSGVAVDYLNGVLYVITDSKLLRIGFEGLPLSEPTFLGVGLVPSTSIVDGYATTDPSYLQLQVKDSPFGGTLSIFGNLSNFKRLPFNATHYQVTVQAPDGSSTILARSWGTYHWNPATDQYDWETITPEPGGYYAIPPEYPAYPYRWYPSYLMMVWPSSTNGLYSFSVKLFQKTGTGWSDAPGTLLKNDLTLLIDNSPATVSLVNIRQHGSSTTIVPCAIVSGMPNSFDFELTASDPNQHLLSYNLAAYWGKDKSENIPGGADSYSNHVDAEGKHLWSGVSNLWVPPAGWAAHCNCAHTFYLGVWKRTINGYNYILYNESHQSITINNTGTTCP